MRNLLIVHVVDRVENAQEGVAHDPDVAVCRLIRQCHEAKQRLPQIIVFRVQWPATRLEYSASYKNAYQSRPLNRNVTIGSPLAVSLSLQRTCVPSFLQSGRL